MQRCNCIHWFGILRRIFCFIFVFIFLSSLFLSSFASKSGCQVHVWRHGVGFCVVLLCVWCALLCCWMVNYFKEVIIARGSDLSESVFRWFSNVKCLFLFHVQWQLSLFLWKTVTPKNWLLIFRREHIPKTSRGNRRGFCVRRQKPEKSSETSHFVFFIFLYFFKFFSFFTFSFFFFFLSFSFSFSFSVSFSFSFLGCSKSFFLASCFSIFSFSPIFFCSSWKMCFFFFLSFSKYTPRFQHLYLEFNKRCFLRCRCSMEMWCLDPHRARYLGLVGLGHQLGREHDSTPQSGVEAPRLSKRSLSRLFCFCCCCCCVVYVCVEVWGTRRVYIRNAPCVYIRCVPVCTGNTSTCLIHVDVLPVHTETFWMYTRRWVSSKKTHVELSLAPEAHHVTAGLYPFKDWEQVRRSILERSTLGHCNTLIKLSKNTLQTTFAPFSFILFLLLLPFSFPQRHNDRNRQHKDQDHCTTTRRQQDENTTTTTLTTTSGRQQHNIWVMVFRHCHGGPYPTIESWEVRNMKDSWPKATISWITKTQPKLESVDWCAASVLWNVLCYFLLLYVLVCYRMLLHVIVTYGLSMPPPRLYL